MRFFRRYNVTPPPRQVHTGQINVWNEAGALRAIRRAVHEVFLENDPKDTFMINFANGSFAELQEGDDLWKEMKKLCDEGYFVYVCRPCIFTAHKYRWNGSATSRKFFDAIYIRKEAWEGKDIFNNTYDDSNPETK
jgi:hypothetical protein